MKNNEISLLKGKRALYRIWRMRKVVTKARTKMMLRKQSEETLPSAAPSAPLNLKEYAVVMFDNESISVVPTKLILNDNWVLHEHCTVKWKDGKRYVAELLFLGTKQEAEDEEKRVIGDDDEDDSDELGDKLDKCDSLPSKWTPGEPREGDKGTDGRWIMKESEECIDRATQKAPKKRKRRLVSNAIADKSSVKGKSKATVPKKSIPSDKRPKKKSVKNKGNDKKRQKTFESKSKSEDSFMIEVGSPATTDTESLDDSTSSQLHSVDPTNKIVLNKDDRSQIMKEITSLKQDVKELKDSMKQAIATFKQIPPSSHVSDGKTNMPPYLRWSHPLSAEGSCDTATDTSYPRSLMPMPLPIMSTYHVPPPCYTHPERYINDQHLSNTSSGTDPHVSQHSNTSSSTGPHVSFDSDDFYVPPLPPPVTPISFQSHDEDSSKLFEDDAIELTSTSSDQDSFGSAHANVSRFPLKQRSNNSLKKRHSDDTTVKKVEEKIYPITEVFNPLFLEQRKRESISRPNFATILVRNFFNKEVRITSNVAGKCGKNQLNKDMMAAIKVATFRMWPLKITEEEKNAWRLCTKAIDEAGRRLYRSRSPSIKENTTMKKL